MGYVIACIEDRTLSYFHKNVLEKLLEATVFVCIFLFAIIFVDLFRVSSSLPMTS